MDANRSTISSDSPDKNQITPGRYSFSSGLTNSGTSDDSDEDSGPYSVGSIDRKDWKRSTHDVFLRDVPMEEPCVNPTDSKHLQQENGTPTKSYSPSSPNDQQSNHTPSQKQQTIIEFDHDDQSYHSTPLKSNQEYYDVLQMANHRLARDAHSAIELSHHDDINNHSHDRLKKQKKKSKKKKSKKKKQLADAMEKFKQALKNSENDWEYSTNGKVDSPQISGGMTQREMKDFSIDDDNDLESFNVDVPRSTIWRPATLVNLAASKSGGKIDRDGYYKPLSADQNSGVQMNATTRATAAGMIHNGASLVYERLLNYFQPSEETKKINRDFNLQSLTNRRDTEVIGQSIQSSDEEPISLQNSVDSSVQPSAARPKLEHIDSIVWGDESIIAAESTEEDEIEMHDYSYRDLDASRRDYHHAHELVVERMKWKRESKLLTCLMSTGGIFLITCIILYIIGNQNDSINQSSSSMPPPILIPNNNTIGRKEPPPRPDVIAPRPLENYSGEISHPITASDLEFVIGKITDDQMALADPNSPQGKAYTWCKEDLINYKINNAARLAQRYSLAVLYYATNFNEDRMWTNATDWLTGHECQWYGIKCVLGDDKVMHVTYIDLSNNSLEGSIPPELGFITSLTQLQLWGNRLYGKVPQSFLQLVDLVTLYLDKNQLSGEIYNTFESMRSLKHLDLSHNKFRGKIPHGLGSLTTLIDLRLSSNHFSGGFPVSIETLPNLQTLLLDNNAIGGTLPRSISKMASLVTLRIHENDFMGNLPDFTHAILLEEAHLDNNYFTGALPPFGSKRLRSLYLGHNAFTGSIPPNIGDLSKLEDFNIQANHLIGPIPESITKLTALQHLDVSFNRLTASIPESFSNLMQLRELLLNDNRLTGKIPDLELMKRIEIVRLNNNLLSGDLNFSLGVGDLNYLQELSLHNNDLDGIIPEFICDLLLDTLTADCWGPSSSVDCPCCSACF